MNYVITDFGRADAAVQNSPVALSGQAYLPRRKKLCGTRTGDGT